MKKLFYALGAIGITGATLPMAAACGENQNVDAISKMIANANIQKSQVTKDATITASIRPDANNQDKNQLIFTISPATGAGKKISESMIKEALISLGNKASVEAINDLFNMESIDAVICEVNGKSFTLFDNNSLDIIYTNDVPNDYDYFSLFFFDIHMGPGPWIPIGETFKNYPRLIIDGENYKLGSVHGVRDDVNHQAYVSPGPETRYMELALTKEDDQREFVFIYDNTWFFLKEEKYVNGSRVTTEKFQVDNLKAVFSRDYDIFISVTATRMLKAAETNNDVKAYFE